MTQIFVSYSRKDSPIAKSLTKHLRGDFGVDGVWLDDRIRFGQDFWEEILQAIGSCKVFLFLVSDDSLTSSYCMGELMEAYRLHKRIIPIFVRDTRQSLPHPLPQLDFCDMRPGINKSVYEELRDTIQQYLDQAEKQGHVMPINPFPTQFPGYPVVINQGSIVGNGSGNTINNGLPSWAVVAMALMIMVVMIFILTQS